MKVKPCRYTSLLQICFNFVQFIAQCLQCLSPFVLWNLSKLNASALESWHYFGSWGRFRKLGTFMQIVIRTNPAEEFFKGSSLIASYLQLCQKMWPINQDKTLHISAKVVSPVLFIAARNALWNASTVDQNPPIIGLKNFCLHFWSWINWKSAQIRIGWHH